MARHAHDLEPEQAAPAVDATSIVGAAAPSPKALTHRTRPNGRSCIVTREAKPPSELIRFVLSPDTLVTPDIRRVLPGRGVWVTARRSLIAEAARRKVFAKAFRKEAKAPEDLADQVGRLLRQDALQALALANKAGAVTFGFEKVKAALAAGEVLARLEANDGSPEGRRKLASVSPPPEAKAEGHALGHTPIVDGFASDELDLAMGRSHVIHAALLKAPAGQFALTKCLRFRRFELNEN